MKFSQTLAVIPKESSMEFPLVTVSILISGFLLCFVFWNRHRKYKKDREFSKNMQKINEEEKALREKATILIDRKLKALSESNS